MAADLNHDWVGGGPVSKYDSPSRLHSAALLLYEYYCTEVKYFGLTPVITKAGHCCFGSKFCSM